MSGAVATGVDVPVQSLRVAAFELPTDRPESDGTLAWDSTTVVVVEAEADGQCGLGYTYGPPAIGSIVAGELADVAVGSDAIAPEATCAAMSRAVRNAGISGLCAYAISAVDVALHDLKARLLGVSLADLLGRWHDGVEIYGSGGFTSYTLEELADQAQGWADLGLGRVKIKVGRDPAADLERLATVRKVVGDGVAVMVDANGAFTPAAALRAAHRDYARFAVTWLEEPVSSDDHEGLRQVRDAAPAGMAIAAGEYATGIVDHARLLDTAAVDVLQPDVTRCGGVTGVLRADALARSRCRPISAHCAPAISAHVFAACETTAHLEYFHDHVRIESILFDGVLEPADGRLVADARRPGLGLELKRRDAERFRA
jgi:L-alanine-DL-glutamate epimerase-like enolase superfamily enzyme